MSSFRVLQRDDRVDARTPVRVAIASIVVFVAAIAVSIAIARAVDRAWPAAPARATRPAPAQIHEIEQTMIDDTARGLALRDAQRRALERYEWVDRDAGVARIPIDRAIDLVTERAR